jgi:hypothetical protein
VLWSTRASWFTMTRFISFEAIMPKVFLHVVQELTSLSVHEHISDILVNAGGAPRRRPRVRPLPSTPVAIFLYPDLYV